MDILLLLLTSIFAGILPMICWAVLVWWFDRYEKEPLHLLVISFLWGVAPAIVIAAIVELVLALLSGYSGDAASTGISIFNLGVVAPLVEEGVKMLGLLGVFWIAGKEIDGPLDGIIYGAMVGFGFAATENVLFFLSSDSVGELLVMIFLRAMVFGSLHAMIAAFTGLGLAFAKYARGTGRAILWAAGGYLLAVVFHSIHNIGLILAQNALLFLVAILLSYGIGLGIIIMLSIGSLIRERRTIQKFLQPYIGRGLLTEQQWQAAGSMRNRLAAELTALGGLDFKKYRMIARLHTLCAELAFKEKQQQLWGKDPKVEQHIARLTMEIRQIVQSASPSQNTGLV
ncbi:MAG: PrsW family intramembrane metalloprotease [Anaerolineales bacterium]|nr:PrsW family intramembrane metalloprotease [Anaerolineales bacterium]